VGPLNLLQLFAWANMLHDYSDDRTLTEAAEMTFSGEHPCEMCLSIADAKSKEQKKEQAPLQTLENERPALRFLTNLDLPEVAHWHPSASSPRAGQMLLYASNEDDSVPTPPPRALTS